MLPMTVSIIYNSSHYTNQPEMKQRLSLMNHSVTHWTGVAVLQIFDDACLTN